MVSQAEMFLQLIQEECGGMRTHMYRDALAGEQRIGQAFMNALRGTPYYDRLLGTDFDPFNYEGVFGSHKVYEAIEFLTTK